MRAAGARPVLVGAILGVMTAAGASGLVYGPSAVLAQDVGVVQSEILTLDPDRLFASTLAGRRLTAEYEAERDRLIASNRELEAELRAEEQALTDARKDLTPKEFRLRADAFDAKVRSIRLENDGKARELERNREVAPLSVMRMAEATLIQLMRETGGKIILDNRQVLMRSDTIDITDMVVTRLDEAIGDGANIEDEVRGDSQGNAVTGSGDSQTSE